jgi:enolase-phosphatase E1
LGDLTKYLSGYFDTEIGGKREFSSYVKIAKRIAEKFPGNAVLAPGQILFISDVVAELEAAAQAGMQVAFSLRPGNSSSESDIFRLGFRDIFKQITSFDQLILV